MTNEQLLEIIHRWHGWAHGEGATDEEDDTALKEIEAKFRSAVEPPAEPAYVGPDCEHDFAYVFGEGDLRTVECTKCRWVCFAKDRLKQTRHVKS